MFGPEVDEPNVDRFEVVSLSWLGGTDGKAGECGEPVGCTVRARIRWLRVFCYFNHSTMRCFLFDDEEITFVEAQALQQAQGDLF